MASLLVIGGILLAAKYADEHAEKRNRQLGPDSENYTNNYTEAASTPSKTSKRDRFKPKYWHSRRKARDANRSDICEGSPPPYAELPAYRDLEKMDDATELDSSEVGRDLLTVHEAPGTPHEERYIKDRLPELA